MKIWKIKREKKVELIFIWIIVFFLESILAIILNKFFPNAVMVKYYLLFFYLCTLINMVFILLWEVISFYRNYKHHKEMEANIIHQKIDKFRKRYFEECNQQLKRQMQYIWRYYNYDAEFLSNCNNKNLSILYARKNELKARDNVNRMVEYIIAFVISILSSYFVVWMNNSNQFIYMWIMILVVLITVVGGLFLLDDSRTKENLRLQGNVDDFENKLLENIIEKVEQSIMNGGHGISVEQENQRIAEIEMEILECQQNVLDQLVKLRKIWKKEIQLEDDIRTVWNLNLILDNKDYLKRYNHKVGSIEYMCFGKSQFQDQSRNLRKNKRCNRKERKQEKDFQDNIYEEYQLLDKIIKKWFG